MKIILFHKNRLKETYGEILLLLFLLIPSLLLLQWGNDWGLNSMYHPDELALARPIINQFIPIEADFSGILNTQPNGFMNLMFILLSIFPGHEEIIQLLQIQGISVIYSFGRNLSTIFTLLSSIALYYTAKELYSKDVGLLSAIFLSITPVIVWNSHYFYNDIPAMCFVTFSLLFAAKTLHSQKIHWPVLSSVFAVFALSTKSTGGIALLFPVIAILFSMKKITNYNDLKVIISFSHLKKLFTQKRTYFTIAIIIILPFILNSNMITLYDHYFPKFIIDSSNLTEANYDIIKAKPWILFPIVYSSIISPQFILGLPLFLFTLVSVILLFKSIKKENLLLLIPLITFQLIIGLTWTQIYFRYLILIIPITTIIVSRQLILWTKYTSNIKKYIAIFLIFIILTHTALFTIQTTSRFSNDTRDKAQIWIYQNIKHGSTLMARGAFSSVDSVRLNKNIYQLVSVPGKFQIFNKNKPDYFITSTIADGSFKRHTKLTEKNIQQIKILEFIENDNEYKLIKTFESEFIHKSYYTWLDPYFEGFYISPTIKIYQKNN